VPMGADMNDTWAEGIRHVHEQAGGVLELTVIEQEDVSELLACARSGDREAGLLAALLSKTLHNILDAPRSQPALCGRCSEALRSGRFAVALVLPLRGDVTVGVGLAICHRCATTRADVQKMALVALQDLWPDLKPVTVTHFEAGHA